MTGHAYEQLVSEHLFLRLGMTTARFGNMATPGQVDGPWAHALRNGKIQLVPPQASEFVSMAAPVGHNVCCSVRDLGKFVRMHLQGACGASDFFQPETFRALHAAMPPGVSTPSWWIRRPRWALGRVLCHNGTNNQNFAVCYLVPTENYALSVMTNIGGPGLLETCEEISLALVAKLHSGARNVTPGDGTPPDTTKKPRPPQPELLVTA